MTVSLVMLWVQHKTLTVHLHGGHLPGNFVESELETGRKTLIYASESMPNVTDAIDDSKKSEIVYAETLDDLKSGLAKTYHNDTIPLNLSSAVTPSTSRLVKRFPRYMIIGFGKAGTKALYEALKLHPSLSGPLTERRYFSRYYSKGLWSYLTHLPDPPPGGFTIEKSPDYITSPETPKRIVQTAKMIGINSSSLKFIVVLRNPIDRAMSEYLEWNIQHKLHHQPLLPSFSKMVVTTTGEVNLSVLFLKSSCYAQHILNWLQVFSQEQMCFVDGDQFISNPYEEVHILEQCMGIRQFFTQDNFVYQPQRGFYCFLARRRQVCMNASKGRRHPDIPRAIHMKLKRFFHPWNEQLFNLTRREFTKWNI